MRAPWIVKWSGEEAASWLAYDDRLKRKVVMMPQRPGWGIPLWKDIHPVRQRRCILDQLCQVCGLPIRGELISLGYRQDDGTMMDPLVCRPCAAYSVKTCPELRLAISFGELELIEVNRYVIEPTPSLMAFGAIDYLRWRARDVRARPLDWLAS